MRATDLLGRAVLDASGRHLGRVVGLHAVQDGPPRGMLAAARLDSVFVSRRRLGGQLGYQDPQQKGPWIIATTVRRLHRHDRVIPLADLEPWDNGEPLRIRT